MNESAMPLLVINPMAEEYSKKYIIGTDEHSLKLFFKLCSLRIYIDGFIDNELQGKTIYHKRIYGIEDISVTDSILLTETPKKNILSKIAVCDEVIVLNPKINWSDAYIYGAGYVGTKLLSYLQGKNITVRGFIDSDETKIGSTILGVKVYSKSVIATLCSGASVIEAGKYYQEIDMVVCQLNKNVDRFFYTDIYAEIGMLRDNTIWIDANVFFDGVIFLDKGFDNRKIFLCGMDYKIINKYFEVFKLLDFANICMAKWEESISENEEMDCIEDALLEDDFLIVYCCAMIDDENLSRLCNLGLERGRDFCDIRCDLWERQQYLHSPNFKGIQMLDINLAYTRDMGSEYPGISILGENRISDYKIAVLGGSTSTSGYFWIKSWPEFLYEKYYGKDITIFNGAVEGYTSAQELIKLMRDIVCLKPDLLIVYDGYNDVAAKPAFPDMPNPFAIPYMKTIMEYANRRLGDAEKYKIFCGMPSSKSAIEDWLKNIEYMHAVCEVNDIKFFSFIQPLFYSKPDLVLKEDIILNKKWDFHFGDSEVVKTPVRELRECAKEISKTHEYIYDLSHIFDDEEVYLDQCHVFENGNQIIASEIYRHIQGECR